MIGLIIVVPTRLRPHAVVPLAEAFAATCTSNTWLVFVADGCPQASQYQTAALKATHTYPRTVLQSEPRRRLVGTLNHVAVQLATASEPPSAVGYMGDDHCPLTKGWDTRYIGALGELGSGLVYGNDLIQGNSLPTQVAITTDIIAALGYMAPPSLTHMYCDNFWRDLGTMTDAITYLPDVTIEHRHPSKTGQWDDSYRESNATSSYAADEANYAAFCVNGGFNQAVEKVRALRGPR